MRVLVTGGAGYIGSVNCAALLEAGHDVLVIDNLLQGHRDAVKGAALSVIDLADGAALNAALRRFRPDLCMHFAARNLVGESMTYPLEYFENNLVGTVNLLRAMADCGCDKFVFSSSASTYGDPVDAAPITEDAPQLPLNPYGKAKLMVEQVLDELDRAGTIRFVSLRYFNAAGADLEHGLGEDHRPETHLIPNVISAALGKNARVSVFGTDYNTPDGTCIRDYIHVVDLAAAHLLAMEYLAGGGHSRIFNLGNGNGFSVREVIKLVREVSGREFDVAEEPRREGDPEVLVASSDRISRELGWRPRFGDLHAIVESAWRWHSAHPEGYEQ